MTTDCFIHSSFEEGQEKRMGEKGCQSVLAELVAFR